MAFTRDYFGTIGTDISSVADLGFLLLGHYLSRNCNPPKLRYLKEKYICSSLGISVEEYFTMLSEPMLSFADWALVRR